MSKRLTAALLAGALLFTATVSVDAMKDVMVNDAKVVMADVPASNGVIHAIDTVIMPKM